MIEEDGGGLVTLFSFSSNTQTESVGHGSDIKFRFNLATITRIRYYLIILIYLVEGYRIHSQ